MVAIVGEMNMQDMPTAQDDLFELLLEKHRKGVIDRRTFLKLAGLGAAVPLAGAGPALAQLKAKEIVIANSGGDYVRGFQEAFGVPFEKSNPGVKVVVDGSGASSAKIKAMVEAKSTIWDTCDRNLAAAQELGQQGLLEDIDYSIVNKSEIRPEHVARWGCASYMFAYVIAYQTNAFGGRKPMTWKDFWNVKEFPGKRALRKHIDGQLEAALLADGADPKKLYPIDMKRALDKIKEIKPHCIFWSTGAEIQQLMRDGEVVMSSMWNHRAAVTRRETNRRVDFHFNEGIAWVASWIVPKGNPAGKDVFHFIRSAQAPERQLALFNLVGNGPTNPAASALIAEDEKVLDPGSTANYPLQIPIDNKWYADNSAAALTQYIDAVS
jgi:putative spermidine/putrescine transport system substrate-binding protein